MTLLLLEGKEVERLLEFIDGLNAGDRIAVLHHHDSDGLCSAAIVFKAIERIRGKAPELRLNQDHSEVELQDYTVEALEKAGINKLFVTDLAVTETKKSIENLCRVSGFCKIVVIDHHSITHKPDVEGIIYVNAYELTELGYKYPASKMCYDLFSRKTDLNDVDWIACIGILGDVSYSQWKDFVDNALEKHGCEKKQDAYKTCLGDVHYTLTAVEKTCLKKLEKMFEYLLKAKGPREEMPGDLVRIRREYDENIKEGVKLMEEKMEKLAGGQLLYYFFKPPNAQGSVLSNRVSFRYHGKTVVTVEDIGTNTLKVHARNQGLKVKTNELISIACKSVGGAGGGHVPAAGGNIPKDKENEFREKIIELLESGRVANE